MGKWEIFLCTFDAAASKQNQEMESTLDLHFVPLKNWRFTAEQSTIPLMPSRSRHQPCQGVTTVIAAVFSGSWKIMFHRRNSTDWVDTYDVLSKKNAHKYMHICIIHIYIYIVFCM